MKRVTDKQRARPIRVLVAACAFAISATSAAPASAAPATAEQDELLAGLMGWAVSLSAYPAPDKTPSVEFVPQQFFDDNACGGKHCRVWGWYPNTGQDVVYVREEVGPLLADGADARSLLAASIVVHEFVHYLQAARRGFAPYDCNEALQLEREAYYLQSAYLVSYGRYLPVGLSMHTSGCVGSDSEDVVGKASS